MRQNEEAARPALPLRPPHPRAHRGRSGGRARRHGDRDRSRARRADRRARAPGRAGDRHRKGPRPRRRARRAVAQRHGDRRATRSRRTGIGSPECQRMRPSPVPGFRIAGNIPYNITSPLIDKALALPRPTLVAFLLQREVADRIAARPGSSAYGALSVGVQACASVERVFRVGAGAFTPPPEVDSAVIRLRPHARRRWWRTPRSPAFAGLWSGCSAFAGSSCSAGSGSSPAGLPDRCSAVLARAGARSVGPARDAGAARRSPRSMSHSLTGVGPGTSFVKHFT